MAYDTDTTQGHYRTLPSGFTPAAGQNWTMSVWANFDSQTGEQVAMAFNPSADSSDKVAIGSKSGNLKILSNGKTPGDGTTLTNDTWYHLCLDWDGTDLTCYLDGSSTPDYSVTPSPALTWADYDQLSINHINLSGAINAGMDGTTADAALWDVLLTDAERASLVAGISAAMIRPASLIFHTREIGDVNDLRDNTAWAGTHGGGGSFVAHPNIIFPAGPIWAFIAAAVSTNITIGIPTGPWRD